MGGSNAGIEMWPTGRHGKFGHIKTLSVVPRIVNGGVFLAVAHVPNKRGARSRTRTHGPTIALLSAPIAVGGYLRMQIRLSFSRLPILLGTVAPVWRPKAFNLIHWLFIRPA